MRRVLRLTTPILSFILLSLAAYTVEVTAEATGYSTGLEKLLQMGWSGITDAGYGDWVGRAGWLFSGIALTLWVDFAIRRYHDSTAPVPSSHLVLRSGERRSDPIEVTGENFEAYYYFSHVDLKVFLVFSQPIHEGRISVLTTADSATWTECNLTERSLVVEIKANLTNATTLVAVSSPTPYSGRQQQRGVEQKAITVSREQMESVLKPIQLQDRWWVKLPKQLKVAWRHLAALFTRRH